MRLRLALAAVVSAASPVVAQQGAVTNADYARAERYMSYNTAPLVAGGPVRPTWLPGDRFVYRVAAADSSGDVMIVDPVRGTRARLLDDTRLATAAATALGTTADVIASCRRRIVCRRTDESSCPLPGDRRPATSRQRTALQASRTATAERNLAAGEVEVAAAARLS
jgi:hypothetical protein